jgi:hypothetical protein
LRPRSSIRAPLCLTQVCVQAVLEGSPIPPHLCHTEHSFVGYNDV